MGQSLEQPVDEVARYLSIVTRFSGKRVLVVGDVMLDRYLVGEATHIANVAAGIAVASWDVTSVFQSSLVDALEAER